MRRLFVRALFVEQRGFGLAEILVSCVILAIGLVALASAIPLAAYGMQEGKQVSTATFLANARLEEVKHATWTGGTLPPECPIGAPTPGKARDCLGVSAPSTAAPQSDGIIRFLDEAPMAGSYADYSRQVRVTEISPDLRQVTVTVGFRPLTGVGRATVDKQLILTTLVAKR